MAKRSVGNQGLTGPAHRRIALAPGAEAGWLIPALLIAAVAASLPLVPVPGLPPAVLLLALLIVTKRYIIAGGES